MHSRFCSRRRKFFIAIKISDTKIYSSKETTSNSMASRDYLNYQEDGVINGTLKIATSRSEFETVLQADLFGHAFQRAQRAVSNRPKVPKTIGCASQTVHES